MSAKPSVHPARAADRVLRSAVLLRRRKFLGFLARQTKALSILLARHKGAQPDRVIAR
jgi:hypothetical protein